MKKDLWIRLRKYRFKNLAPIRLADRVKLIFGDTDAFTRAFAAKIAKKHGWSNEFAFLAIREYKKFVFLGVTSHYELAPSVVIYKVWHEHQLFTKGYREFCVKVLRQRFDHSPELIPFDIQTGVFNVQYHKTLVLYEQEFGTQPPPEIWNKTKLDPIAITRLVKKLKRKNSNSKQKSDDSNLPLFSMFKTGSDSAYAPVPVTFLRKRGNSRRGGNSSRSCGPSSANTTESSSGAICSSVSSSSSSSDCGGGGGGCD